jgi:hypothetical protein
MRTIFFSFFILASGITSVSQNLFRSGIFLHHSTGECIWGPNGSSTSVPLEMDAYNTVHNYTGQNAVTMNEEWWSPSDNEWVTQHTFFEDPSPVTGIGYYLPGNKIIVIKSCFPSSAMSGAGSPDDTLSPDMKTMYNYKWHWRHIVNVMKSHPENFFVIWTNAPLEPNSTNPDEAALSKWFCSWAKDTLAMGLDPVNGSFPQNIYVFDFFQKLTGSDGMMLPMYASAPGDSHPNAAATALVAPQFVEEIFDASIGYESIFSVLPIPIKEEMNLKCNPNPIIDEAWVSFTVHDEGMVILLLYNDAGEKVRTFFSTTLRKGEYSVKFLPDRLTDGLYEFVLYTGNKRQSLKIQIIH